MCVQINEMFKEWFEMESGVRQGNSLSPTLFFFFYKWSCTFKEKTLSLLLYADDIVIMPDTPEKCTKYARFLV